VNRPAREESGGSKNIGPNKKQEGGWYQYSWMSKGKIKEGEYTPREKKCLNLQEKRRGVGN